MESYTQEQLALYSALAEATGKMQAGDENAYNDIYNMMFPHVNALIQTRGISGEDAVDVAQETMISVYKYISTIKDPQSTYKWIMSLANNKIVDYFRKNAKRFENETYITSDDDDMGEAEQIYNKSHDNQSGQISIKVPEDIFVNKEKQQMLLGVVNSLKEDQKQVVMMHCFSDMTFKDIADVLGVSENTVKTKFYRALNKLEASIYEVEKKEGVRLHSMGIVPFLLFIYMLCSKQISVSASMRNEVTQRVGKEIEDMKKPAGKNNISKSSAVKSAGAKTAVISHKAVAIVTACVVGAGAIAGGAFALANANNSEKRTEEKNPVAVTEILSETQTETESETKSDAKEALLEYYDSTLVPQFGTADRTFVRNYSFNEGDDGEDMSKDYIDTTGNQGLAGKKMIDVDGDDTVEMLVGNIIYNDDTTMTAQILIYDYDEMSGTVEEVTDGKIKSYPFGWCNDTVQFAYQVKDDGFYIYSTDMYTYTWYEGGYKNAVAYVWKIDNNGVTDVLNSNSYGDKYMEEIDYLDTAKDVMPTVVNQWNEKYNDIDTLVTGNFKEIPLIKNISEMDSEYTQLMYIGIGRNEDSTSWEYEYDKTDIPGFTNFYE